MKPWIVVVALGAAVGWGWGCGSVDGPADGLSHARATFTCGPADEAATAIVLARESIGAPPPVPHVAITILRDVRTLAGKSFDVVGAAYAFYQRTSSLTETATRGRVTIEDVADDLTVHGVADLTFASGRLLTEFTAPWQPSNVLCP